MQRKACHTNFKSLTRPQPQKRASVLDIAGSDPNETGALGPLCSVSVLLKTVTVCTSSPPQKLTGAVPTLTKGDRSMWTRFFRQNPVPMALCRSPCPVEQALMMCVARATDSSARVSAAMNKTLEGSAARIDARAYMNEMTA